MAGVRLESVFKAYGDVQVVHGIDLQVHEQEFVVLVGPSGCGKSTTLRMIAGLEEITDGELFIDNRLMNRVAPKDRDVAMVFQNYALYPHLNVADNIAFGLRIRRTPKADIEKSVTDVAAILGLTEYLDRRPADLSGGQRQRVAMGRAIVRHPKVFLFDEPLSNLDAKLRTQMRAEIKRLHKRLGATSVYVTHDQVEAMTLADRIVVMNDGIIAQVGTPMELFRNPADTFVAGFIGSPPMNQLKGNVSATEAGYQVKVDEAVFRPEHLALQSDAASSEVPISLDLVETLGSEALLHATLGEQPLIIKADTHGDLSHLSDITRVYAPTSLLKVFDAETGRALEERSAS
jgi:multiple sugar transport system ATP-binding protein